MHPAIFAAGIAICCFSLLLFLLKRARYSQLSKASGKVVDLLEREDREGRGTTFAPRIEFQTKTGQTITFVTSVSTFPAPRVGDSVTVLYHPNNPTDATLDAFLFKHTIEVVLFLMGALAIAIHSFEKLSK